MPEKPYENIVLIFSLSFACLFNFSCTTIKHATNGANVEVHQSSWLKPGILTSDRIKAKFGSFGVQVLLQDELSGVRLSNLYSEHDGEKITRAIALVAFERSMDDELKKAHLEILDGGSIGSTLTKHGFTLQKNALYRGALENMPIQLGKLMKSKSDSFATLIYDLIVKSGNKSLPYCTITEVYSPEFLTINELNGLYDNVASANQKQQVDERLTISKTAGKVEDNLALIRAAIDSL